MTRQCKGIGLLSGGLDSALAALVLRDAGAEVECLHFFTGFCVTGHNSRVGRKDRPIANHALQVAADMGVAVDLVDIADEYLPVVLNPRFGYGKNMNPCVDCRVFMLNKAKEHMERVGADFVFTGEVLGQRPKSQLKRSLRVVEEETQLRDRLLRPLSAKLLEPTAVERDGRVDRNKLFDISGRGRTRQIELAKHYGLTHYMQPAGGCCFLTDEAYSNKLRDAIRHDASDLNVEDIFVLGVGRHFRISSRLKIIVGRDEVENTFLESYARDYWSGRVTGFTGPIVILMGEPDDGDLGTVASIAVRYSDGKNEPHANVEFSSGDRVRTVKASAMLDTLLEKHRI